MERPDFECHFTASGKGWLARAVYEMVGKGGQRSKPKMWQHRRQEERLSQWVKLG